MMTRESKERIAQEVRNADDAARRLRAALRANDVAATRKAAMELASYAMCALSAAEEAR